MMCSGQEKGLFYALDLGGTNFRVIQLSLEGNGKVGKQVKGEYKIGPEVLYSNNVI
jgi:hexokinase